MTITPVQHNTTQYSTKLEAIAAMSPTYFTGRPCRNGHTANRYTSNGMCVECLKEHRKTSGQLARNAKIKANNMRAKDMIDGKVWVPRKQSILLHTITRLLNAENADQFATWLMMIDQAPMGYAQLQSLMDWRDNRVNVDYMTFPQRHDDAGTLQIELTPGCWYVGDEVMRVLRGELDHCCRVWE